MQSSNYDGAIHPELAETSNVFAEVMRGGDHLLSIGIDPATAAVIVAAVPISLRLLRMANEMLSASIDDQKEEKRLDRKRREYELDREFGRKS